MNIVLFMSIYYVYILQSLKDEKFYIGFTRNVLSRLDDHNRGNNSSTRCRRPLKLIYFEGHLNKTDALRREKYFKTSRGKRVLKLILRDYLSRA